MNRRLTFFAVIEIIILLFLCVALFRNGFVLFFGLAILFSWLASRSHSRVLGVICGVLWLFTVINLIRSGYFWLAVAFPIVMGVIYYRHRDEYSERGYHHSGQAQDDAGCFSKAQCSDNELIDLADLHYHPDGNNLTIRKLAGNTKIIVPEDVELALSVQVHSGVVKVFEQTTEINDVNLTYFTPDYASAEKRVALNIKVETGNVELVRG
ncbi:cell wall-active antibiotics response protein LiaF [Lactovum odontotermitis]